MTSVTAVSMHVVCGRLKKDCEVRKRKKKQDDKRTKKKGQQRLGRKET